MATVAPIIDKYSEDDPMAVYFNYRHVHNGFVPDYDELAVAGTGLAAFVCGPIARLAPAHALPIHLLGTVMIIAASASASTNVGGAEHTTQPGAGLWLCWATVILSNWKRAVEKKAHRL